MKKLAIALFVFAFFGSITAQANSNWEAKVSSTLLAKTNLQISYPVIIILDNQADVSGAKNLNTKFEKATYVYETLKKNAKLSQAGLCSFLNEKHIPYQSLFIINGIKTELNQELIKTLAQRNDVKNILENATQKISIPTAENISTNTRQTIEWGIDMINANDVWAMGFRGKGVVVGGEDTGYQWNHEALKNAYRGYDATRDTVDHNFNWHDAIHGASPINQDTINPCGYNTKAPCDDFGHGSHTMGTMVGLEGENEIGVAPEAKWCGCRNMERGAGSPFTYLECFQWFLAPTDLNNENADPAKSPSVINNSWGCPESEGCNSTNWDIMNEAIINLRLGGVVVVLSAGNSGPSCSSVDSPAAIFEESFTVGATASNDSIIGFSSRGPVIVDGSNRTKPNVSAPGVNVRSVKLGGGYTNSSGTSMAGPHVAATVALMICANPALDGKVEMIEDILENTAVPKTTDQDCGGVPGSQIPNNTYGYGRIDALAAVEAAIALIPTSTKDLAGDKIKVYPNPAHNEFLVAAENLSGNVTLDLFDVQGKIILRHQWSGENSRIEKIDISVVPSGVYFYKIRNSNFINEGKLVKE